jgi:hypothetical protein
VGPHREDLGHEYQSDDCKFGRIAEDTAGELLRRTGTGGCQCVLCRGRRREIERRHRVWMLLTNIGHASYHSQVLRVNVQCTSSAHLVSSIWRTNARASSKEEAAAAKSKESARALPTGSAAAHAPVAGARGCV